MRALDRNGPQGRLVEQSYIDQSALASFTSPGFMVKVAGSTISQQRRNSPNPGQTERLASLRATSTRVEKREEL